MLKKTSISQIKIHSDEWKQERVGRFTSSQAFKLMSETAFQRYVRLKTGEAMTGKPSSLDEVDTDATRWGILHEIDALKAFGRLMNLDFLVTQQLILDDTGRFSSTPDALIVKSQSPDGLEYEVEPVEVKCPPTYDNYLLLWDCHTPADLKAAKKEYYWQVLDQMDITGAIKGHFFAYHPDFASGNYRHLSFNVIGKTAYNTFPIYEDLKALKASKAAAAAALDSKRNELLKAGKI